MRMKFLKSCLVAVCLFAGISAAQAFPNSIDRLAAKPKKPKPPHCDPWFTDHPHPTPSPTPTPEPTFEPVPIAPGDDDLHTVPPAQVAYGDCDDDEPEPSPTPTPDVTPTPPPSDNPDDPGEQNFPTDPGLFLEGSGTLFGCQLNVAAPVGGIQGLWIFGMILVPAIVRRFKA